MPRTNPFPSESTIEKLNKALRAVRQEFAGHEHVLTPADRRRMARPRTGGETIVSLMIEVATQVGVDLPQTTLASLRDAQSAGARLRVLHATARALYLAIADTAFSAESRAWSGGVMYYTVLSRMADHNEHLRAALQPAVDFFSRRSPAVREEQTVARAERKVEKATKKAAKAKKAAEIVKARRADTQPVPAAARDGGNGGA